MTSLQHLQRNSAARPKKVQGFRGLQPCSACSPYGAVLLLQAMQQHPVGARSDGRLFEACLMLHQTHQTTFVERTVAALSQGAGGSGY